MPRGPLPAHFGKRERHAKNQVQAPASSGRKKRLWHIAKGFQGELRRKCCQKRPEAVHCQRPNATTRTPPLGTLHEKAPVGSHPRPGPASPTSTAASGPGPPDMASLATRPRALPGFYSWDVGCVRVRSLTEVVSPAHNVGPKIPASQKRGTQQMPCGLVVLHASPSASSGTPTTERLGGQWLEPIY